MSYLSKYPKNRLTRLFDEIEESFFNDQFPVLNEFLTPSLLDADWTSQGHFLPMVDVNETADHIVVSADLPGLSKKDMQVTLKNNILEIRGNKKYENRVCDRNYVRVEREFGSFIRQVPLPKEVVSNKVKAKYNNGVLDVMLLKKNRKQDDFVRINIEGQKPSWLQKIKNWFKQKFNKN